MTDKEMLARIEKAIGQLEASIHHVQETNHRRLAKLEGEVAADLAEVRQRLNEMTEGVVRNRDAIHREFTELAGDVRAVSGRVQRLEPAPHAERYVKGLGCPPDRDPVPADVFCVRVPAVLWNDIKDCLRGRMFIHDGDYEDNDEEVCGIINRIEKKWGL